MNYWSSSSPLKYTSNDSVSTCDLTIGRPFHIHCFCFYHDESIPTTTVATAANSPPTTIVATAANGRTTASASSSSS